VVVLSVLEHRPDEGWGGGPNKLGLVSYSRNQMQNNGQKAGKGFNFQYDHIRKMEIKHLRPSLF
jgi:hypothetical protein